MTQPVIYTGNPASAPQPMFWPELVGVAIDIMILIALASWAFSQAKKAWRGEEVKSPLES